MQPSFNRKSLLALHHYAFLKSIQFNPHRLKKERLSRRVGSPHRLKKERLSRRVGSLHRYKERLSRRADIVCLTLSENPFSPPPLHPHASNDIQYRRSRLVIRPS
uniref:Uncharacterized protein n=1 Tax=Megaviridae environmental sample TaxID=1737588 RepID=A0A5J6VIZ1_9VIRU|nr:MAG: hypothetical protein [Megaviridae environmental sample]